MPGCHVADVVFCLDASSSMGPCFDALRKHVQAFVKGLESGGQFVWDLRLGLLAYSAGSDRSGGVFSFQGLGHRDMDLIDSLYHSSGRQGGGQFFTTNVNQFSNALEAVEVNGDEATFIALDTALDYPWREAAACHRVVIVMTDEALETGVFVKEQERKIPALIEKLHALRVKLFIVGPSSDAFDSICAADRSEFQVLDNAHDGLKNADFNQILGEIGKSVSVSALQGPPAAVAVDRGLFGQAKWSAVNTRITGA
jgi:hypothetical protein